MTAAPSVDLEDSIGTRDVSVVIPARAADATLERCLRAIATAEPAPGEVIVVVDGRDERLVEIARACGAKVIESPAPRGAGAARNLGASAASGSILFFIDADVVIARSAIGEAAHSLREYPEWSAVFGSYDEHPGAANFVSQYKGLLNHFVHQTSGSEASTFWTAMGAIRKEVFTRVGGFDEKSRLEDVELGYRVRAAGHRIGFNHHMFATHLKQWTARSMIRSDIFDRALPWTELILRYRNSADDLNLDRTNRTSVACVFALLVAMIVSPKVPLVALPITTLAVAALLVLNRKLYAFFYRRRGLVFLARAIPFHWLYFLYGGGAFVIVWIRHRTSHRASTTTSPEPVAAGVR